MIVVEGPDGGGKTTMARRLVEEFGLEYRRPPVEVLSSTAGPTGLGNPRGLIEWWIHELSLCQASREYKRRGVYDRTTYISDPIYRLAYGGDPAPQGTVEEMGLGLDYLVNYSLVIFCIPTWEQSLVAIMKEDRPRLNIDEKKLYAIWWAYNCQYELFHAYDWSFIKYDWTNLDDIRKVVAIYVGPA